MNVVITGHKGYIGSALVERLESHGGVHVQGFDTKEAPIDLSKLEEAVAKALIVIPLAAVVGAPACERRPKSAYHTNVEATRWLVERTRPLTRFIYLTTDSGYVTKSVATEETPMQPKSLYARTKRIAEQELLATGRCTSFRLGSVFGVSPVMRDDLLLHAMIRAAVRGERFGLRGADVMRAFVSLNDVCRAVEYAVGWPSVFQKEPYNLASFSATKAHLAAMIRDVVPGADFPIESGTDNDPDGRNYALDCSKIEAIGFKFLPGGLHEIVEHYRAQVTT